MLALAAVSATFSRSPSNAGRLSTSANTFMTAGTSAFSALIEAVPASEPIPVSIDAARASRNSSRSSGFIAVVPPVR